MRRSVDRRGVQCEGDKGGKENGKKEREREEGGGIDTRKTMTR